MADSASKIVFASVLPEITVTSLDIADLALIYEEIKAGHPGWVAVPKNLLFSTIHHQLWYEERTERIASRDSIRSRKATWAKEGHLLVCSSNGTKTILPAENIQSGDFSTVPTALFQPYGERVIPDTRLAVWQALAAEKD